ncbi:MBL fold metallo-hydrolase [Chitinophaga sp. HK235]|uniref:MBL fold metallo-hydrolase n=1 Tax=Chitinophaga sp. HK235 TaxID=2952571 RepID=UPI001BAA659E|nr:MBL fold metallo-hydrolase [Chitinophaga sp. HK235]
MTLQLLRNATQWLTINNKHILIDPMLSPQGAYPAVVGTGNEIRNPTVDLPIDKEALDTLLSQVDAVLLTHLHRDHWDLVAQERLPKNTLILCQPADADKLKETGFTNIIVIEESLNWEGISIYRTGGQHGTGDIGIRMGIVSGYVLEHAGHRLYIAGDTIWCDEVRLALDRYQPQTIVVNGGAARFETGDPIVMDIKNILEVCRYAPDARIYVVHLEAVNHSREDRNEVRAALRHAGVDGQCFVPDNGEVFLR